MKILRRLAIALGIILVLVVLSWLYTKLVIANARADGEYASAEEGMMALMDQYYPPDREVKIFYAGPNEHDGDNPYVWYVIAEVRASARADGSQMGLNGCDNPGTFFLQLKDGKWVHVPEGLFTTFMTSLLDVFDMAGEGQSTPTTNVLNGPTLFCR